MNSNAWNLIYNKLKILVDPQYFADRSMIEAQVNLVTMLHDYLEKTDPVLCDVEFYYPKYIEEELNIRRVFNEYMDKKVISLDQPKTIIDFFNEELIPDKMPREVSNGLLSIAVENKIPFILSNLKIERNEEINLLKKFNVTILNHVLLKEKIKAFLQGFFNYYKFDLLQGINSPDMAHAMSDSLHKELYVFESKIKASNITEIAKERIRSFVHNRYIDILVTIDKINFYKIQQQILDIERNILDNKEPQFHGAVRYYLNYYLLLLWGYIDHLCLIINDIFEFGYDEETVEGRRKIGFGNFKSKEEYLGKLKNLDKDLYNFVISKEFQEWLGVLGQLRHKNAHKEMISPSPLLQPTDASKISDEEIDAILYKDNPAIDEQTYKAFINTVGKEMADSTVETQKVMDRHHYRISKMDKIFDHIAIVKEGVLDPVARINIDMENIKKLTTLFLKATEKSNFNKK